jgi:hypothetical protein
MMLQGETGKLLPPGQKIDVVNDHQGLRAPTGELRERIRNAVRSACIGRYQVRAGLPCRTFSSGEHPRVVGDFWIEQKRHARKVRYRRLQELELPWQGLFHRARHAGHVGAGARQAVDQAASDWINRITHHDRDRACHLPHQVDRRGRLDDDDVDLQPHEILGKDREARISPVGEAPLGVVVAAGLIAKLAHALHKAFYGRASDSRQDDPDSPRLGRLLRTRR